MTEARLKILIIIPNLGRGGAQQVFRQQLKYLHDYLEVTGCVFNWEGAFEEDHTKEIVSLDVPAGKNYFSKGWYFTQRILRLRKLKQKQNITIAISHLEGADYVNLLSSSNDKTVCWIHGSKAHDRNINGVLGALRMKFLMPLLYKRSSAIVTVSKGIAYELASHVKGLEKMIHVIYNGFDLEAITILSKESLDSKFVDIFDHTNSIITHCRLAPQKNLNALLKIFSQITKSMTKKLVILGDGELRDELLTLCDRLGLKNWNCWNEKELSKAYDVYFLGQQMNPFKFLSKADLYVMPSAWEGFPLALCEAMACRVPVISADCFTGPREIIAPEINEPQPIEKAYTSQYGTLMPLAYENDPASLSVWVKQIESLLGKSGDTILTNSAVDRVCQFQLSEAMAQTVKLLREI
jgi:glycosyltransferase involved in cell wall biosynthesis